MTIPIIFFGDHPGAQSGLARIMRDLALRVHGMKGPETDSSGISIPPFRVCSLGYGSPGSIKLPFPQYQWKQREEFLPLELPHIIDDFCAPDEPFVLMTVGDVQRFLPLADAKFCPDKGFGEWVTRTRRSGRMKLWGYFPVDAHGISGGLGPQLGHTLSHYDRRVVPSEWAKEIVRKTLPHHGCDAIPHGIDTGVFYPRPKEESRDEFGLWLGGVMEWPKSPMDISDNALWVGIVATNQNRKDWALGIAIAAELRKTRPIALWIHTDRLKNEWSILELLSEFGLLQSAIVTVGNVSDEVMAQSYSAMDITLGIGRGEGFGYPIFESIFCGTPCFSGFYGAQSEWMDDPHLIPVDHFRIEGPLGLQRPIYRIGDWMHKLNAGLGAQMRRPNELEWDALWPLWAKWFRDGIK
jgi:glycosyltransferase involved in cell wall biosynthesis